MPVLTVRISDTDHASLRELAWRQRTSMSDLVRFLIEQAVAAVEVPPAAPGVVAIDLAKVAVDPTSVRERAVANADRLGIPLDRPVLTPDELEARLALEASVVPVGPPDNPAVPVVDPPAAPKSRSSEKLAEPLRSTKSTTPAADAAMPAAAREREARQAKEHTHKRVAKGPLTGCRDCDEILGQDGVWRLPA